jgi:hypothetical protein
MALPASGAIDFSQIGSESQLVLLSPVSMNDTNLRKLVNKKAVASPISANDFYGKTWGVGLSFADTDFVAQTGMPIGIGITSNKVAVQDSSYLAIFCDLPASFRINGGTWVDKSILGDVVKDDYIEIQLTTSSLYGVSSPVTVKFGPDVTKTFDVSTGAGTQVALYLTLSGTSTFQIVSYPAPGKYIYLTPTCNAILRGTPDAAGTYVEPSQHVYDLSRYTDINYATGNVTSKNGVYTQVIRPVYYKVYISCLASEAANLADLYVVSQAVGSGNSSFAYSGSGSSVSTVLVNGGTNLTLNTFAGGQVSQFPISAHLTVNGQLSQEYPV